MTDLHSPLAWNDGPTGGTPMTAARGPRRWEASIDAIDAKQQAQQEQINAILAALAAIGAGEAPARSLPVVPTTGRGPATDGQVRIDSTIGRPVYALNGAWREFASAASGGGTPTTGDGSLAGPANFQAVVNEDNSVATSWNAVAGTGVTYTLYEVFRSPNGVSGAVDITATSSLRPSSSSTVTREYFVRARVGGVETADSQHVTVYLPYGTQPSTGGGTTDPGNSSGGSSMASILDLGTGWTAYLGIGIRGSSMLNIPYSELVENYERAGYYYRNTAGDGVVFKSYMDGGKTENSSYSRVELREMKGNGVDKADFTIGSGRTHIFEYTFAVPYIQPRKPWCTIGQIHDAKSDALAIKLMGANGGTSGGPIGKGDRTNLELRLVIDDNIHPTVLLSGYNATQGAAAQRVTVRIEVTGETVRVYVNGSLRVTTTLSGRTGCYFKAGNYPQSHATKGDGESASEYCEVVWYSLNVTHTPSIG